MSVEAGGGKSFEEAIALQSEFESSCESSVFPSSSPTSATNIAGVYETYSPTTSVEMNLIDKEPNSSVKYSSDVKTPYGVIAVTVMFLLFFFCVIGCIIGCLFKCMCKRCNRFWKRRFRVKSAPVSGIV